MNIMLNILLRTFSVRFQTEMLIMLVEIEEIDVNVFCFVI